MDSVSELDNVWYESEPCFSQNAGEESVANIDKLRHANGNQTTADLRLKMQKVRKIYIIFFSKKSSLELR
jgi:succinate dehydrogenase/fumarate reductase flavoprotein subunit